MCLGDRLSVGDRRLSIDRDRLRGDGSFARRSFFMRSFSFMICSNAARGSSIMPVPILSATPLESNHRQMTIWRTNNVSKHTYTHAHTPWYADATAFDCCIIGVRILWCIGGGWWPIIWLFWLCIGGIALKLPRISIVWRCTLSSLETRNEMLFAITKTNEENHKKLGRKLNGPFGIYDILDTNYLFLGKNFPGFDSNCSGKMHSFQ